MEHSTIVRGAPEHVADPVNDFFESCGLGRAIDLQNHNGHVTALLVNGQVVGAGYAATATSIADTLILNGRGVEAFEVASSIHAVEALAVHPDWRGRGHATTLLSSIAQHAFRDFGARFLVARIDESDLWLQRWYARRLFRVCEPGLRLSIDGVPLPKADGYLDGWRDLTGPTGWSESLVRV